MLNRGERIFLFPEIGSRVGARFIRAVLFSVESRTPDFSKPPYSNRSKIMFSFWALHVRRRHPSGLAERESLPPPLAYSPVESLKEPQPSLTSITGQPRCPKLGLLWGIKLRWPGEKQTPQRHLQKQSIGSWHYGGWQPAESQKVRPSLRRQGSSQW